MKYSAKSCSYRRASSLHRLVVWIPVTVLAVVFSANTASAQLSVGLPLAQRTDTVAELEERLVNRLRATRADQKAYLEQIVQLVDQRKLPLSLVVAIERYALRRNPHYPFPFFERALNYQARKRGVTLPSILHFQDFSFVDGRP